MDEISNLGSVFSVPRLEASKPSWRQRDRQSHIVLGPDDSRECWTLKTAPQSGQSVGTTRSAVTLRAERSRRGRCSTTRPAETDSRRRDGLLLIEQRSQPCGERGWVVARRPLVGGEAAVIAREDHRLDSEELRKRLAAAASQALALPESADRRTIRTDDAAKPASGSNGGMARFRRGGDRRAIRRPRLGGRTAPGRVRGGPASRRATGFVASRAE